MSYESPINLIQEQTRIEIEDQVCRAVTKVGVVVDKDELIKALQYDREQYKKGYNDRDAEIVRCKDCTHWDEGHTEECDNIHSVCFHNGYCPPDFYCGAGAPKGGDNK